ncbi:MAG: ABC transporter permease subunit [Verrucomicrobiota bacterium]
MSFLPVVERELRVQARSKAAFRIRLTAAATACGIVFLLLLARSDPAQAGHSVFTVLAWMALVFCLVEGARTTTDTLSNEKREGTLGLLFLTDLKGYDVVLGKLAGTSLNSLYGALAIFPALAIPLITGGVTPGEFWRLVLVLVAALIFSMGLGLAVSSICERETVGWGSSAGLLLFFAVALPMIEKFCVDIVGFPVLDTFALASPSRMWTLLFEKPFATRATAFWKAFAIVMLLGIGLIALATLCVCRFWRKMDEPRSAWKRLFAKWNAFAVRPRTLDPELRNADPMLWLTRRYSPDPKASMWFVALAGVAAIVVAPIDDRGIGAGFAVVIFVSVHLLLLFGVIVRAAQLMMHCCGAGGMELVLTSPQPPPRILAACVQVLKELYGPWMMLLVLTEVVTIFFITLARLPDNPFATFWGIGVLLFHEFVFGTLTMAAGYFAMLQSLRTGKVGISVGRTVLFVVLLPQLSIVLYCIWPIAVLVASCSVMQFARTELETRFRQNASRQFSVGR